ncbi:nuclear transport factor 2 family protein [Amycolatopsis sp. NPDC051371]|uniref:nuclear transport factor 2 family protein n=1 Tax=Amycolatopsis sp. NPDC051371 TaxID=3155800 RepID=UPI00342736B8
MSDLRSYSSVDPAVFVRDFFTGFTREALDETNDPADVVDRYYSPDIVQNSDGIVLDRAKLIAHVRPLRKNLEDYRFDVHEAVIDGTKLAARLTIHARMRRDRTVVTEVHLFGELLPDGRLRRTDQLTRTITTGAPPQPNTAR